MLDVSLFKSGYREGGWKHYDSIAPGRRTDGPATDPAIVYGSNLVLICGECEAPQRAHGKSYDLVCNRLPESMPYLGTLSTLERSDYYLNTDTGEYVLLTDYAGAGTRENVSDWLATEYEDWSREYDAVDNWRDKDPDVGTAATEWWYSTPTTLPIGAKYNDLGYPIELGYNEPKVHGPVFAEVTVEQRNAFIEGNDGFMSIKLLDEVLTEKYHNHLLNIFLDRKTNDLRIGGIRIVKTIDGKIEARCVQNTCAARMSIDPVLATRDEQETFILAIIRHGNNHAAKWFTTRQQFYKVHADNCTLDNCPDDLAYCVHTKPTPERKPEDDTQVAFIIEHRMYCRDSKCTCEQWLNDHAPQSLLNLKVAV